MPTRLLAPFLPLLIAGSLLAADAGKEWGIESRRYNDPVTSVPIVELSTAGGSNLYFHHSNFTADNGWIVFYSSRTGKNQLFGYQMSTGKVLQLTDETTGAHGACPHPKDPNLVYYLSGADLKAVDLKGFVSRTVATIPPPGGGHQGVTVSGDGRYAAVGKVIDDRNWEVGRIDTTTGAYQTVVRTGFRIGHIQHSPTDPWIFYVWETGGYAPQRTWLVDADGRANRPFYYRAKPQTWFTPLKEWVTHEAWVQDTGQMTMILDKVGILLVEKTGEARLVKGGDYWHCAARPDGRFIIADDNAGRLWLIETATGNERLLATGVRGPNRAVHAEPSFDRQGRYVIFNTARDAKTVALIDLQNLKPMSWTAR